MSTKEIIKNAIIAHVSKLGVNIGDKINLKTLVEPRFINYKQNHVPNVLLDHNTRDEEVIIRDIMLYAYNTINDRDNTLVFIVVNRIKKDGTPSEKLEYGAVIILK